MGAGPSWQWKPPGGTTWSGLGSPWGASAPQRLRVTQLHPRAEEPASRLFSPALRTSSATWRTEPSRAGRLALGSSQRTKYSRWGPPSRGLWAGRVSRCKIWASNILGSRRERWGGVKTRGPCATPSRLTPPPLDSCHPATGHTGPDGPSGHAAVLGASESGCNVISVSVLQPVSLLPDQSS